MSENLFHRKLKIVLSILILQGHYIFQYRILEVFRIKNERYLSKDFAASLDSLSLLSDFDQFL